MSFNGIKSVFAVKDIRKKIVATLALVLVYKLLSVITVPGADTSVILSILESDQNQGLAFFSSLMGGGLANFSIILMGLSPYINAVIIIQLLGVIVPKIGDLQKEGEAGQRKTTKMTRWLTLPLAFAQSYGMIFLMNGLSQGGDIIDTSDKGVLLMAMTIITGGTIFLMWLGELMTEKGIGNGISILITAGVLASVPSTIVEGITTNLSKFGLLFAATLLIIYIIIKFTEGNRRIPIIYTRTGREEKSYFPIRVNQAGMIPIIFAISLITFPSIIGQLLADQPGELAQTISTVISTYFDFSNPSWYFIALYFLLVLGFSFFYVSITFNTDQVAENIQKRGGYIPGIRPGSETSEYFAKVSNHLNLFGGGFLAIIAVTPFILSRILEESTDFIIPAAGLIIIVSVILDVVRKVDSEMKMFDYSKFK
ncbi:preprotein translocase subunit SecY [Candidatus Gracilibacteria bacterium]|nr:preprotein translocase subunit SecY [Candidatus Gracilibacteria bacterium]